MSNVIESKFKVIKNLIDFKVQNRDINSVCVCASIHIDIEEKKKKKKQTIKSNHSFMKK